MAQNKNRKKKNRKNNGNHEVLGVTLIVISAFLLLCIVIKPILGVFSEAIFGVLLGVFGIAAYPCLIAVLLLGIFVLCVKKVEASLRTKVGIALAAIFLLIILQLASTHSFLSQKFTSYIDSVYSAKYSAGGIIMGLLAFGLKSLITEVACYIVFSLAFIVDIAVMTSAVSRIKAWSNERKIKAAKPAETPEPSPDIYSPIEPQLVIDATPMPGLFTGRIERNEPEISVETGRATDMSATGARKLSDYSDSPIMDEPDRNETSFEDHSAAQAAARVQIYSGKEEIKRQTAQMFKIDTSEQQEEVAPPSAKSDTDISRQDPGAVDPALRVYADAQNAADRPRRVDYEGTPNNLNALYFPLEKNIRFNDVGIETLQDPPHVVEENTTEILDADDPAPPAFGMPRVGNVVERVEPIAPIIDASQPIGFSATPVERPSSLAAEDKFLRTLGLTSRDIEDADSRQQPIRAVTESPVAVPERIDPTLTDISVPPLETDRFRADDILDANDGLSNFTSNGNVGELEQEEILDGSKPIEDQLRIDDGDDGILDGSLIISDEPAVDMSEKFFDNGDILTGEDTSGMYVPLAESEPDPVPAQPQPVKPTKSKRGNAPLENQVTIDNVLQQKAEQSVVSQETKRYKKYNYAPPPYDLLKIYDTVDSEQDELQDNAERLSEVVSRFLKAQVSVINVVPGPQVTRYELDVPSGISVKSIESRTADIAYELATVSGVRVEAPIPGKRAVGIEVPNKTKTIVGLREIVSSSLFIKHKSPMLFSVGKDIGGELVVCDLEKVPHLLIAGQTGSGKSAGLNSLIVSLLYKASPDDLRFILIDPKRVEFSKFRGMPHLLFENTITEPTEALNALKWAENEMNRRFTVMQKYACSKLAEYNAMPEVKSGKLSKLPHIVIIIDELANLMQSSVGGEIESRISVIAALARAAGIHLIVATQRPSADVITGTIKANLTSRIAFKVPDATNSRIIIDIIGAEALTGDGDMLFYPQDAYAPKRVQGSFVSGEEVLAVVNYLKEHYECDFDASAEEFVGKSSGGSSSDGSGELDALAEKIMAHAIKSKQISTSVVQRRFAIGYARAARIIDNMEAQGYIGPTTGNSKPRDVLMTEEQYRQLFGHGTDDI